MVRAFGLFVCLIVCACELLPTASAPTPSPTPTPSPKPSPVYIPKADEYFVRIVGYEFVDAPSELTTELVRAFSSGAARVAIASSTVRGVLKNGRQLPAVLMTIVLTAQVQAQRPALDDIAKSEAAGLQGSTIADASVGSESLPAKDVVFPVPRGTSHLLVWLHGPYVVHVIDPDLAEAKELAGVLAGANAGKVPATAAPSASPSKTP